MPQVKPYQKKQNKKNKHQQKLSKKRNIAEPGRFADLILIDNEYPAVLTVSENFSEIDLERIQ